MKILVQHIENLLSEHDCVVVPGLGGFVQNEVRASADVASGIFYPYTKEICFNPRLKFNDGLLAQSFQEIFGLTFEEANQQIQVAVQEIHRKLEEGKFVRIGRIGTLTITDEQLLFRPDHKNHFLPESYGLSAFAYPKLADAPEREEKKPSLERLMRKQQEAYFSDHAFRDQQLEGKRQTETQKDERPILVEFENAALLAKALKGQAIGFRTIDNDRINPKRRRLVQFMVGFVVCILFLLVSKPVGQLTGNSQQANLMLYKYAETMKATPVRNVGFAGSSSTKSDSVAIHDESITSLISEAAMAVFNSRRSRLRYDKNENVQNPESAILRILQETLSINREVSAINHNGMFYIIVSTFSDSATAETWLSIHSQEPALQGSTIIHSNGWYRVSTRGFRNESSAVAFLRNFTESNPEYSNAWIFNQTN